MLLLTIGVAIPAILALALLLFVGAEGLSAGVLAAVVPSNDLMFDDDEDDDVGLLPLEAAANSQTWVVARMSARCIVRFVWWLEKCPPRLKLLPWSLFGTLAALYVPLGRSIDVLLRRHPVERQHRGMARRLTAEMIRAHRS